MCTGPLWHRIGLVSGSCEHGIDPTLVFWVVTLSELTDKVHAAPT
jgi:hypothetical protein